MATSASDLLERLQQQLAEDKILSVPLDNIINKGFASMTRDLSATHKRIAQRNEAAAQQAEAAAVLEDELAADLAAAGGADPAAKEAELKAIQQQVEQTLQEDAEAVGPEPPSLVSAIKPTQAQPALQLQELPVLQPLLGLPQQLLGAEAGSSSEDGEARAAEAFAWLLGQRQQLRVCPDAATAKAVFQAVWCSNSSELARAAYGKFLGWCGMPEGRSGGDAPGVGEEAWLAAGSTHNSDPSLLCGAPAFLDQQPSVSPQWLPGAEDFVQALTAMGCCVPAAAAAASTPAGRRQPARSNAPVAAAEDNVLDSVGGQQDSYADANLPLLLSLLRHLGRLGAQGRVQVQLGGGDAAKQLALLLMALMLDPRAAGSAAGRGLLQDALAALLAAGSEAEWQLLQGQLLEALQPPGMGPSSRSTVLLLSQLPLTARCAHLRQQGALQLLRRLLPPKKQQQQQQAKLPRSGWAAVHSELFLLLGEHPDKALAQGLTRPKGGTGSSKAQRKQPAGAVDIWALLDILDAANLLLWTDLVRPEYGDGNDRGVSDAVRGWFGSWMEQLERGIGKELKFYRLRSRLTELRNAYEFGSALGANFGGSSGSGDE